jgi:hypothetical protein
MARTSRSLPTATRATPWAPPPSAATSSDHAQADGEHRGEDGLDDGGHHHGGHAEKGDGDHPGHDLAEELGHGGDIGVDAGDELAGGAVPVEAEVCPEHPQGELVAQAVGDAPRQGRRPPRHGHSHERHRQAAAGVAEGEGHQPAGGRALDGQGHESGQEQRRGQRERGGDRQHRAVGPQGAPVRPHEVAQQPPGRVGHGLTLPRGIDAPVMGSGPEGRPARAARPTGPEGVWP